MNYLIISVISFSIGILFGGFILACGAKAFDRNSPGPGDSYIERSMDQYERQEKERLQQREIDNQRYMKPC